MAKRKTWDGWRHERDEVNRIIKALHEKGRSWKEIADGLNIAGLKGLTGSKWTNGGAASYALRYQIVARRNDTKYGLAGSKGQPTFSKFNGLATSRLPKGGRAKASASSDLLSDQDIEDVMTSTLATNLKMKIVRIVALAGF